jgi:hypothetical protein
VEAALGLLGVIIGAALVLLGDWLRLRREAERQWHGVLIDRSAAFRGAEWQQAKMIDDWRRRRDVPLDELKSQLDQLEADRRVAVSYLMVLPGTAPAVRAAAIAFMQSVGALTHLADAEDEEWAAARERYRQARDRFDLTVRSAAGGGR